MRRLESYVRKYGPDFGPAYYHMLQSHAAHASVSARLRRKLDVLSGKVPPPAPRPRPEKPLPLFEQAGDNAAPATFQTPKGFFQASSGFGNEAPTGPYAPGQGSRDWDYRTGNTDPNFGREEAPALARGPWHEAEHEG